MLVYPLAQPFHARSLTLVETLAFGVIIHECVEETKVIAQFLDLRFSSLDFFLVIIDDSVVTDREKGIDHLLLTSSCLFCLLIAGLFGGSQAEIYFLLLLPSLIAPLLSLSNNFVLASNQCLKLGFQGLWLPITAKDLVQLRLPGTCQGVKFALAVVKFLPPVVKLGSFGRKTSTLNELSTKPVVFTLE
ncbi:hypothetical protein HG531_002034 [Fusarium graminearum]|nr:hypothetical protein HG531_002034 [Fusarium graminearum]